MANLDPTDDRPEEATDEMAAGAATAAAYGVPGTAMSGGMAGTAAGAVAGQLAADAIVKDEQGMEDDGTLDAPGTERDNADSGDSFAGEGSPGGVASSGEDDI